MEVVETRGRKRKYNFDIPVGICVHYKFKKNVKPTQIRSALASFIRVRKLKWKLRTWVKDDSLHICRLK